VSWQRDNVQAAAAYLRERIAAGGEARVRIVYEGLLDVLDPARRTARLQRDAASVAKGTVTVQASRERRSSNDRRATDRRRVHGAPPGGIERRESDRRGGPRRR
jgi:hypothetical protein